MANANGVYIAYDKPNDSSISDDAISFTALQPAQQHALDADPAMRVAFWRYGEKLSTAIERAETEAKERRERAAAAPAPKPKRTETAAAS